MPRPRVLSFMSQWGGGAFPRSSPSSSTPNSPTIPPKAESPPLSSTDNKLDSPPRSSPRPPQAHEEPRQNHSRSSSMVMPYQPPVIETAKDTPPELAPIFSFLNSHANKLYQEGYFLKLHDLDSRETLAAPVQKQKTGKLIQLPGGRPSADRVWNECFAQLVGTVLSLWDAAQLDAAGEDGEVIPTFINLTDASIKMIESLPMNSGDDQSLQNVLSISTAANNRYLLHFNSLHSLTQWTAGIRLAIFEHSTLQEAYTGSIIAGKGKNLNNIRGIMERSRFPTEDWVRVRFGAGTPWRRCWCVVSPPDEKEVTKVQKAAKKRSAYERAPAVKGDIKFYETRKVTKKTRPIATIKDAFAAYSIYPQSKALIEQSTLIKVEGKIVIHSDPETTTEGFVFLMPEVHPAVTGFEIMLRFLLPIFDSFNLYGRPTRLIADVLDSRSLMFAMPNDRRYGCLDLIDVAGLIHTEGSQSWTEYEWRKQLKQLTAKRMSAPAAPGRAFSGDQHSRAGSRSNANAPGQGQANLSGSHQTNGVRSSDEIPRSVPGPRPESRPGSRHDSSQQEQQRHQHGNMYSAPQSRNISNTSLPSPYKGRSPQHQRAVSDAYKPQTGSRLSFETPRPSHAPPPPPQHAAPYPQPPPHENMSYPKAEQGPPPPMHRSSAQPPAQGFGGSDSNAHPYPTSGPWHTAPAPPQHGSTVSRQPYMPEHNTHLGRDEFPPVHGYEESWGNLEPPPAHDPFQNNGHSGDSPTSGTLSRPFTAVSPPFATNNPPFNPVAAPPSFAHKSNAQPPVRPNQMPEMRRANSAIDAATLAQLAEANRATAVAGRGMATPPRARDDSQLNFGPLISKMPSPQRSSPQSAPRGPPPSSSSTSALPERRLPTIPGTPAVELDSFGMPAGSSKSTREIPRERSSNSIQRKPVPGQSRNTSRSPNAGQSPER